MEYKAGQRVLVVHDWSRLSGVKEGTLTQNYTSQKEWAVVDGEHYSAAYVFPISAKEEILQVITKRAELKKAYDDSMKLVYEVCNKRSRGEFQ